MKSLILYFSYEIPVEFNYHFSLNIIEPIDIVRLIETQNYSILEFYNQFDIIYDCYN